MHLNRSQRDVVEAGLEPLLVVAGPGAGKTTVLSARIERLLSESAGSYRKVLGITYTNVAANNLKEKIDALGTEASDRTLVSTFHGFSTRLLQQHGLHIGLDHDFTIVNELSDRLELLTRAGRAVGVSENTLASRGEVLLRLLARLYERCVSVDEVARQVKGDENVDVIQKLFVAYSETSIAEKQLEFSLLVHLATKLLVGFKPLATQIRQIYQYVCVDEFQDTNAMQFRLLEAILADDSSGLLLLADQDQIIYQWNGASPTRLRQAAERFDATVLQLPTSYRCPDEVVAAATRLIAHNSDRFVKSTYDSERGDAGDIEVAGFDNEGAEAEFVAQKLAEISPEQWSNTAVLARNRKILQTILKAAEKAGIACYLPVPKVDFESPPLVMLQSILRLANRANRITVFRKLVSAFSLITGVELDADLLLAQAEEQSRDVMLVFFEMLSKRAVSSEFGRLVNVVDENLVARKEFRGVSSALFRWVDSLRPGDLKTAYQGDYESEREIWETLERRHRGLQDENVTLADLIRNIDLESKVLEPEGAVRFLTVHGAKGLEFDNVFIAGLAESQFPTFQAIAPGTPSNALEEERRSFFVAITRTMRCLTLTYALRYYGRASEPSRFIGELGLASP